VSLAAHALVGSGNAPSPLADPAPRVLLAGPLEIDRGAHRLTVDGERVRITAMQLRLLVHLIEHRDEVVTRADLLTQVWGYQVPIQTRTVDIHVQRLRERLGRAARLISTVRGVGYLFSEDPEPL
jgi:two-component system, OmpR family, phosphate regulon response regulator PhoB